MKLTDIPKGLQTDFLEELTADKMPVITRDGKTVYFPAFIRKVEVQQDEETKTVYKYFLIELSYTGQDIKNYDSCKIQSYAELRQYFYGPVTVQMEQQLKGTFGAHQYAVRQAFPKVADEVISGVERFKEIKNTFWAMIDEATAKVNKTWQDLPAVFSAEEMKAFAIENGMLVDDIIAYTIQFTLISTNLLQNSRNWDEMFPRFEED